MGNDPTLAPTVPEDGGLIAGRYRIESELARGGIGVVYRARDERMDGRAIVIKVLLAKSVDSTWLQKKFEDERKALVRLNHPNIVAALDCGVLANGQSFLVMEFVQGRSLRAWMKDGPLPLEQIAEIVGQMGRALSAAHERGIHHRDLKPENIMLQELGDGQLMVKIIDFGIATVKETGDSSTHNTQVAGSPLFMAPEQLVGKPTAASDTYALATITYEMLAGAPPFTPNTIFELLTLQREGVKRRPNELRSHRLPVPRDAEDAVLKSLSFSATDRHLSAREFAGDFVRGLRDTRVPPAGPVVAPAETIVDPGEPDLPTAVQGARPPPRASSKSPILFVVAGLAAAVVVAIGLFFSLGGTGLLHREPALAPASAPMEFRYAITAQKYRDGKLGEPFRLPGEMIFGPDDRIRVVFSSDKPGYLYIVNQGPGAAGGSHSYNVLFPVTAAGDSAHVTSGQEISIPEGHWFVFDKQEGVEQLFVVWSERPVPEMEKIKHVANATDRGEVKDAAELALVHTFLAQHPAAKATRMDAERYTLVSGSGSTLVSSLKLEHH
jgi:tRNA A-37 threonylcarbamoyl transferase component Bud32